MKRGHLAQLFGWKSSRHMRRGLPLRELVFLQKWYEDYMVAKYWMPPTGDGPTEDEIVANAPWSAETIERGST